MSAETIELSAAELGGILFRRGMLSAVHLEWALDTQVATGSPLSVILIAAGLVDRQDLYYVLSEVWQTPYIDLAAEPPDPGMMEGLDPDRLAREGWVPVRHLTDGSILIAGPYAPQPAFLTGVAQLLGRPVTYNITTDWDVRFALAHSLREELLERAALGLWRRAEAQSARTSIFPRQKIALAAAGTALVAALALWTLDTIHVLIILISLGFLASVAFKFVVCMRGARRESEDGITAEEVAALRDEDLPVFTVLAPMFREANVLPDLITNLSELDYPISKLEVLLLLEESDTETIAAAEAAGLPPWMSVIVVPRGQPQTKPKACNVGLFFAKGEYLVIYDAEDKPDPDQLKKTVIAFERGGESLVCIQAALNYWNVGENMLTRMFTSEYSFWFDYMLPGLDALRLPIPLGGTSNHFRTDALRKLGGWDPYNVTEDADLGIRASALGYTVGVINSTTYEEANRAYGNWIRQRSRWIKGYMQTALVHTRHPLELVKVTGIKQALGFLLLIGGTPLTFLFVLPLYAMFVLTLFAPAHIFSQIFPPWALWIGLVNLIGGNSLMVYVCMMGAFKRGRYALVLWSVLNPVYWIMHSISSYKALWQLITKPHYWEKTAHGISTVTATAQPAGAGHPVS